MLYNKTYDNFSHEADYEPIIYDLGCVLLKIDDKDYQGDSYVLYGDENGSGPFGFLNFGWVVVLAVMHYKRVILGKKFKNFIII